MTTSIVFDASCDTFVQAIGTGADDTNAFGEPENINGLRGLRILKTIDGQITPDISGRDTGRQIDLSESSGIPYDMLQMKRKYVILKRQNNIEQTSRQSYSYSAKNGVSAARLQRVRQTMNCTPPFPLYKPAYKSGIKGGKTLLFDPGPNVPFYSNI